MLKPSPAPILDVTPRHALLLGFAGPAGCGKSTAAALAASRPGWERVSFAQPLRDLLLALHPAWDQWHVGPGKDLTPADGGLSPREQMRAIGDWVKAYDPGFFTAVGRHYLGRLLQRHIHVANDDVRYEPEARLIRDLGGFVVHVSRTDVKFRRDHDSELGIEPEPGDLHLRNWGTLRSLNDELNHVLNAALLRRACQGDHGPTDGLAVAEARAAAGR